MTLDTLIRDLRQTLVGPVSLIRELVEIRPAAGAPQVYNFSSVLCNTEAILGARVPGATGAAGLTRREAEMGAIGEAVERYAAAYIPWERLQLGSAGALGDEAIGIDAFAIYEDAMYDRPGFPLARYADDKRLYWCEARRLGDGARRWVPAPLVYIPYQYQDAQGRSDFVAMGVSSGQACHSDRAAARLSGLYECIERDAFMIAWTRGLQVPRLDIDSNPALSRLFGQVYDGRHVAFHLFDLTLDIEVPTVLCVAIANGPKGRFACVGCATRLDLQEACEKALLECAQCLAWARYLIQARADWVPAPDFGNVLTFEDHVRLYCEPEMLRELDFLLETPLRAPVPALAEPRPTVEQRVETVLQRLRARGLQALEVELTPPDLDGSGLHTVRVLVPGLATLTSIHAWPALACPRYQQVPALLGRPCRFERANPAPHPFP